MKDIINAYYLFKIWKQETLAFWMLYSSGEVNSYSLIQMHIYSPMLWGMSKQRILYPGGKSLGSLVCRNSWFSNSFQPVILRGLGIEDILSSFTVRLTPPGSCWFTFPRYTTAVHQLTKPLGNQSHQLSVWKFHINSLRRK